MAAKHLDRGAKRALVLASVLIVALPVLAIGRHVSSQTALIHVQGDQSGDDNLLMFKNGRTMLLPQGSAARKVADWLKLGAKNETSFQLGDAAFSNGSANLSQTGIENVVHFSQLLEGEPELKTRIIVATADDPNDHYLRLEEMRANKLRQELLGHGISENRVSVVETRAAELLAKHITDHVERHAQLLVILSKGQETASN